jgi:hypothetical protein
MCTVSDPCGKTIKTFVNNFGNEETQHCIREQGHKGRCSYRPNYKLFGDNEEKIKAKLNNAALYTAGETAENSPILNRAQRWTAKPLSMDEEQVLKVEGKYRVGIRKDEASTFQYCSEIERNLFRVVQKVYEGVTDNSTQCYYCGEGFDFENFLLSSKNPASIQICHLKPLSENEIMHKPENCFWGHRQCNIIQGNQSIEEMYNRIQKIQINLKSKLNK